MSIKKIGISPESSNYGDNDKNVACLYRGYYIWQAGESGLFDAWNFAPAVLHVPNPELGETFEPYWDNDGDTESAGTRRDCVRIIDTYFEQGIANPGPEAVTYNGTTYTAAGAAQPDPDARRSATVAVEEGLHFLQDAAEKFAAAGKPLFAAECYALVERLAAHTEVAR